MDQDKMTIKAFDALQEASSLARQYDHAEIANEHILVALLEQKDGIVPPLVERIGMSASALSSRARLLLEKFPRVSGNVNLSLSNMAQRTLANAEKEMSRLKDEDRKSTRLNSSHAT